MVGLILRVWLQRQSEIVLSLGALLSMLCTGCSAYSRLGSVVISQEGQLPCFAVEDTRAIRNGNPKLYSLTVFAMQESKQIDQWSFGVPVRKNVDDNSPIVGIEISPQKCISFGKAPAGTIERIPANKLALGVIYTVSMRVKVDDPSDPTLMHTADFCLVPQPGSTILVYPVKWDEKQSRWNDDECKRNLK